MAEAEVSFAVNVWEGRIRRLEGRPSRIWLEEERSDLDGFVSIRARRLIMLRGFVH